MFEDKYGRSLGHRINGALFGELRILYWIVGVSLAAGLGIGYVILHLVVKHW